jgi:hypothetical protein
MPTGRPHHVHGDSRITEPLQKRAGTVVSECDDRDFDPQFAQPGRKGENGALCAADRAGSDEVKCGKRHDRAGAICLRMRKIRANASAVS